MRYQTTHLQCLLVRLLQTKTLNCPNRSNPLNKNTIYSRTSNVRVYSKGRSSEEPSMILENEVVVSGMVNYCGVTLICFEGRVGQGIKLFPVLFDDQNGKWCLNLWYANARLGSDFQFVSDHAELKKISQDYFLMLRHNKENSLWTVICRSWRVCDYLGFLNIPTPDS